MADSSRLFMPQFYCLIYREAGFDIVRSCPRCGYLLKSVLREGALYSDESRERVPHMAEQAGGDMGEVGQRANRRSALGRHPSMLGLLPGARIGAVGDATEGT